MILYIFFKGIHIAPLQNVSTNINTMSMVEYSEPDGDSNLVEVVENSEDYSTDDSEDDPNFSVHSLQEELPEYSFSEMYGQNEIQDELRLHDPPASNTRRRKKAQ